MANIITSKFRSDSVRFFLEDMQTNDYYMFISSTDRTTAVNSLFSKNDFLEKTIFGKKIDPDTQFVYMIKNYPWLSGKVYDQYDDRIDISTEQYYTVVYPQNNSTGDYRVFKCLFNNYGAQSISPPNYSEDAIDQIYRTADGYVWKFMYAISEADFDDCSALGYIPITANTLIANTDFSSSTIQEIVIENSEENNGYEVIEGTVVGITTRIEGSTNIFDTITLRTREGFSFSEISGYYSNRYLYAINPISGAANTYIINSYTYNSSTGESNITLAGNPVQDSIIITNITDFSILPRIEIKGDGTGAVAIPEIEGSSIKSVTVLNKGSGYTQAVVSVIDPYNFDPLDENRLDVRAMLRPLLSPRGGHATNLVDELSCKHCLLINTLTETDNNTIPITNQYTKFGLVKNPEFTSNTIIFDNRIVLDIGLASDVFQKDEQVTQVNANNEVVFAARVHEVSANTVYLSEFNGPYQKYSTTGFSLDPNLDIRSSQGQFLEINTIISYPTYQQKTGEVYYMTDFFPVERDEASREQFKIILEF